MVSVMEIEQQIYVMYVTVPFEVTAIVVTSNIINSNSSKSDYMLLMLHAMAQKCYAIF